MTRASRFAMVVMAALCCSAPVPARHHRSEGGGPPGQFDFYVLSLSWSPAYCLSKPGADECGGARRFGFIAHGLWPQNERGWPEHCAARAAVPDEVVAGIADIMPARGLVYHEWSAHGTCSGLPPLEFFALVRRAYRSVVIPTALTRPTGAVETAPAALVAAFANANPGLPSSAMVLTCSRQGAPRLQELRVCLNRDLSARPCPADVMRAACATPTVIVPPVR